jgi:restriction system protein
MAGRRRRNDDGPAQAVLGISVMLGAWLALKSGGPPQELLSRLIGFTVVFLILGFVTLIAFTRWRGNRLAERVETPASPRTVVNRREFVYAGPELHEPPSPPTTDGTTDGTEVDAAVHAQAWSLALIRALEWKRFEELCEGFWKAKGYPAELTAPGADGGVDVLIRDRRDTTRIFAVIQCKSWQSKPVGVETVRALWGAKYHFGAQLAIFYGLSGFTPDAQRFADEKHLSLIHGGKLLVQILSLPYEDQQALLQHVTRDDYTTPTCPSCDVKMRRRNGNGRFTDFFGCSNYPRCKRTFDISSAQVPALQTAEV